MVTVRRLPTNVMRALPGYKILLKRVEAGVSVHDIAILEGVTPSEIYARIKRAKEAREKGWI